MCWPRRRNRRKERILDAGLPAPGQTGQGEHAQAVTLPDLELENQASQRQASPELKNVEPGTSESGLNPVGLSSAEAYKYDPLPDQRLYIRLLEVLPAERDDDLRCYLCVTPLDALPSFEALSYVWGDASTRSTILCHGRPMSISQSLDKALRRFRLEAKSRIIWADAICINQEDFEERGKQVLLMRDIYQTAARVLVWLGSDDRLQASGVFKFAKFVSDLASDASLDDTAINASIERDWPSERDIFSRDALLIPWFRRVWILQEVGLSSDALMTWGDAEIHWDIWARVCNYLAGCKEGWGAELAFSASLNGISTVSSIGLLNFKHGDQMHVGKVLHLARNFRSTYAHDKVYGLLGHPAFRTFCRSQGLDTFIQVDYSGTPFDVYRSVAMRLLQGPNPLYCLCLTQFSPRRDILQVDADISWVPQWIRNEPELLHDEFDHHHTSRSTLPQLSIQGNTLVARGVVVDTVRFCSEAIMMHHLLRMKEGEPAEKIRHPFMVTWMELTKSMSSIQGSSESLLRRLCNVLSVGGLESDEGRHPLPISGTEQLKDCFAYLDELGVPIVDREMISKKFDNQKNEARFLQTIQLSRLRCLFITNNGYLGLGPRVMQPGDVVCVLFGGPMPFILRQGLSDVYKFRGEAYVNGLMKGEAVDLCEAGELREQEFHIA